MSSDKQNINKISKEIVSLAASKATLAVPGVNQEKDIKLSKDKEGFILDIFIAADFGVKIPQLAWDIQNSVKEAVESTTQQKVKAVNIHVQGVMMPQDGSRINEYKTAKRICNADYVSDRSTERL